MATSVKVTIECDGEVTVREGSAAVVVIMDAPADSMEAIIRDAPDTLLRVQNGLQLAMLLAGLISAVQHLRPEALSTAMALAEFLDYTGTNPWGAQPPATA